MCKSKMSVDATQPISTPRRTPQLAQPTASTASSFEPSTSNTLSGHYTSTSSYKLSSQSQASTSSSSTFLSTLKDSLPVPENPILYDYSELCAATNNFLSKRFNPTRSSSSSTPSWRCTLRGKDAVIFQRKFRVKLSTPELRQRLSTLCRSHHTSITKLLGACVSSDYAFLVYEFVSGASLAACLRNPNNPNYTVLSTWASRMQIATDLAQGLDYIHNSTGLNVNLVHNHIKSGSVLVTEPHFNARLCHFGAAQLCGETDSYTHLDPNPKSRSEIEAVEDPDPKLNRTSSRKNQFEGVRGYMSPEFQASGVATQKSDVYAFGVVLLELLSGQEPFKYKFDKTMGDFIRTSVVDSAQAAIRHGGLRTWVDRRLKDSFPVEVAEKLTRLALECVHVDPDQRPSMGRVSGKISKLYLESKFWSDNMRAPTGISVSLAPR